MPQRTLFRRLNFAYGSAATIIGVLIILAQVVIQVQLYNEVQTRNLASILAFQELHSQHLLRNSLMTFDPSNTTINPLHIDPIAQLSQDLAFLEVTNKDLTDNTKTPASVVDSIRPLQQDFTIFDAAGHQLLVDVKKHNRKDQDKQVTLIFIHEQSYLMGVYNAFQALTQQADDNVTTVRVLEIVLCLTALGTITFEACSIVVPAINDYKKALKTLEDAAASVRATKQAAQ